MTSYLRSLFGVGPQHGPARSSKSKAHHRSSSTPPKEKVEPFVFIKTSGAHNPTSHSSRPRTGSYSSAKAQQQPAPSPLRFTTYDPTASHSSGKSKRPPMPHSSHSYKTERERASPYAIYAPLSSFSSTRSASSCSARPGSSASHHTRNASSGSVASQASYPTRPVLKQTNSYGSTSSSKPHNPNAHVTFMNPSRTDTLHMHPVLAYTRQSQAPIFYDVTYPPSSRTVVDRNTRAPVPSQYLDQPATDPTTLSTLVLTSERFPWPVVVSSSSLSSSDKFSFPGSAPQVRTAKPVTNNDVLHTLYNTLSIRVTQDEWNAIGQGSREQKRIWKAYESRCERMGGGWKSGVRRIDWLGDKTSLVGIEVDKNVSGGGRGRLIFARP